MAARRKKKTLIQSIASATRSAAKRIKESPVHEQAARRTERMIFAAVEMPRYATQRAAEKLKARPLRGFVSKRPKKKESFPVPSPEPEYRRRQRGWKRT